MPISYQKITDEISPDPSLPERGVKVPPLKGGLRGILSAKE
jgi:hypothetical protein